MPVGFFSFQKVNLVYFWKHFVIFCDSIKESANLWRRFACKMICRAAVTAWRWCRAGSTASQHSFAARLRSTAPQRAAQHGFAARLGTTALPARLHQHGFAARLRITAWQRALQHGFEARLHQRLRSTASQHSFAAQLCQRLRN